MGYLRFLLALAVVSDHVGPLLGYHAPDGTSAVLGFYVISGLYMAMVLETKYQGSLKDFYWNRFLRIWPVYITVWLAALVFILFMQIALGVQVSILVMLLDKGIHPAPATLLGSLLGQLTLLGPGWSHLFEVTRDGGIAWAPNSYFYSNSLWRFDLIPQAWSLTTELTFYLMAPWVVRWRSRTLALCFAAGALTRLTFELAWPITTQPWHERLVPLDLTVFCAGVLCWRAIKGGGPAWLSRWLGPLAAAAAAFLAAAHYLCGDSRTLQHVFMPLAIGVLALWFLKDRRSYPWETLLGSLSYPVYVSHLLVFWAVSICLPASPWAGPVALGATLAVAYLLHMLVERPMLRFKRDPTPDR